MVKIRKPGEGLRQQLMKGLGRWRPKQHTVPMPGHGKASPFPPFAKGGHGLGEALRAIARRRRRARKGEGVPGLPQGRVMAVRHRPGPGAGAVEGFVHEAFRGRGAIALGF
jgi:hypothetical protein